MTPQITQLRALEIFSDVPDGCRLHLVRDSCHAPHLRAGEFAVIDLVDQTIRFGELYLVAQSRGPALWQINREPDLPPWSGQQPDRPCAMLMPLNSPRRLPNGMLDWPRLDEMHMSDGPIFLDCLEPKIIGRVIGVYQAAPAARALPAPQPRAG
jgi:hypothetical protein